MYNELLFFCYVWLTLAAVGVVAKNWNRQKMLAQFAANAPSVPEEFKPKNIPDKPRSPQIYKFEFGHASNHPLKDKLSVNWCNESELFQSESFVKEEDRMTSEEKTMFLHQYKRWNSDWDKYLKAEAEYKIFLYTTTETQWRAHYAKKMMEELY